MSFISNLEYVNKFKTVTQIKTQHIRESKPNISSYTTLKEKMINRVILWF